MLVRRDLRRNDCLWLFVHGVGRVRRRFRVRLFRSAHCQRRARSLRWPYSCASHAAFGTRVRVTNKSNGRRADQ